MPWWKKGTFTPNKAPIADLANTLSGDNKPGELVYLNSDLNVLKNKVGRPTKIRIPPLTTLGHESKQLSNRRQIQG